MLISPFQSGLVVQFGAGDVRAYLRRTRDAGGGGAFDPASIAGLALWLKADTGLYDATSGGSAVTTDASAVARWEDQSGNANHATQATSGSRPTLRLSQANGYPVLRFDGTDDYFGGAGLSGTSSSVFVVAKLAAGGSNNYPPFLNGPFGRLCGRLSTANWGTYVGSDLSAGETLSTSSFFLVEMTTTTGATVLYRSGVQKATSAFASSGTAAQIGAETSNARYLGHDVAEILRYDSVLSGTDRGNVENYLIGKYSL